MRFLALAALMLAGLPGRARPGSLELRGSAGPGTWNAGSTLTEDLGTSSWTMLASEDYTTVTNTSAPSLTDLAALDFMDTYAPDWQLKAGLDFSNDSVNQILYAGPDLGFTYTDQEQGALARARAKSGGEDDEYAGEVWSLGFSAPIHGYAVNLGANSNQGFTKSSKNSGGVPYVLVTNSGDLYVTQFYPDITLTAPLLSGELTPSILYGHDFYSKDPGVIATVINRRFSLGRGGNRVGNLVGALYTDTITASLNVKLPYRLSLSGSYGASQLISPFVWAVTADAYLTAVFNASYSGKLGWTDSAEEGASSPQALASLTMDF